MVVEKQDKETIIYGPRGEILSKVKLDDGSKEQHKEEMQIKNDLNKIYKALNSNQDFELGKIDENSLESAIAIKKYKELKNIQESQKKGVFKVSDLLSELGEYLEKKLSNGIDKIEQAPEVEKKVDAKLNTTETKVDSNKLKETVEQEKDKKEMIELLQEKNIKNLKSVEDVQKATDKYGEIMDKYGLDMVVGRIPGVDAVSSIFSTLFFIYQGSKLPKGKNLPWYKRVGIFGLQAVDAVGKPVGSIFSTVYLAAQGAILGLSLGPIGATVGAIAGGAGGYLLGGTLFDYFFKANKWSADIFNKHCEKIKLEAEKQGMTAEEISKFKKDHDTLRNVFDKTKKIAKGGKEMYNKGRKNYNSYKEYYKKAA